MCTLQLNTCHSCPCLERCADVRNWHLRIIRICSQCMHIVMANILHRRSVHVYGLYPRIIRIHNLSFITYPPISTTTENYLRICSCRSCMWNLHSSRRLPACPRCPLSDDTVTCGSDKQMPSLCRCLARDCVVVAWISWSSNFKSMELGLMQWNMVYFKWLYAYTTIYFWFLRFDIKRFLRFLAHNGT